MIRVANTENGTVRGLPGNDPRITVFKGIPFAAPPVGENRWRAPQPCENWEGIRDAYTFAPISVQDTPGLGTDIYCREWHVDPEIPMDEDCLYLNVWTPAKTTDEKLPVLVWFFGGGFQWGYTPEMEFNGERIASRGVILVTVNYRLGALGFLAHPELTEKQPEAPANFGSLDQQAGLKWVSRNIEAFGGDSERITIAGQSAGGASTLTQLTCKENFNLINGAMILSGIFRNVYNPDPFITPRHISEAGKNGEVFFEFLGVKTLEEARALDAFYIRDKYAEFAQTHPRMAVVIDDKFCIDEPIKLLARGHFANVPVMAGNTVDEFPGCIMVDSIEALEEKAKEIFGEDADTFLAFDEAKVKTEMGYAPLSVIESGIKATFLEKLKKNDKDCYYYRFNPDIPGWDNPGSFHSVDLWFFFETLGMCWRPFQGRHFDLARLMCNYWTNFVKTGNPNGNDADGTAMPKWKPYTDEARNEMQFLSEGAIPSVENDDFMTFMIKQVQEDLAK